MGSIGLRKTPFPLLPPHKTVAIAAGHFGDKSCREVKGELLDDEGDTPSIFPGESVEEPMLLRLPSSKSGEWLKERKTTELTKTEEAPTDLLHFSTRSQFCSKKSTSYSIARFFLRITIIYI